MPDPVPSRQPKRAAWVDLRFLLGILLIASSVAGVWLVVMAARQTAPALSAVRTIFPGEPVTAADVRWVEVGLGEVGGVYLDAAALDAGLVATRVIGEGELVARAAVGAADALRTTSVVVRSAVDVPASVVPGTSVEVWSAPRLEQGRYDIPRILVPDAVVVAVDDGDGGFGTSAAAVEVVIARADVADVLGALADGAAISIVPALGGAG